MDNFDLRKYLAEGRLLKEEVDVNKILSDGGYDEVDDEELLATVKSRLKGKSNIGAKALNLLIMKIEDEEGGNIDFSEGKLLKEDMSIEDVYNDAKRQVKDIYNIDVPMDVVKQWADSYQFPYSREEDPEDEDNYILVYDFGTEERGDFMYWLHDEWDEMPLSKTKRMGPPEGQWDFSKKSNN